MHPAVSLLPASLNPPSVAVIGASSDPAKFGGRVMHFLLKHGYRGRIIPVHPTATEVLGIPAVAQLTGTGDPVDVCLLALPSAHLATALEDCGRAGPRGAVIIPADSAETGTEGAARRQELVDIARRHGMRLFGPNCLGYINPHLSLAMTSSVALAMEPMPRGAIGLACQSGSLMASLISHAQDVGTGFSVAATVGKGIVQPGVVDTHVVFGALLGAITWNVITWYYGIPSSSSHALIGGIVGAVIAKSGSGFFGVFGDY